MQENKNLRSISAKRSRQLPTPDGGHVEMRPLVLSDWATIEEEAVQYAKRELIQTYSRNADLLPEPIRERTIMDVFRKAESMRIDNLPTVRVMVPLFNADDTPMLEMVEQADGTMKPVQVTQPMDLSYGHYWVTKTMAGDLCSTWLSMRKSKPGLTQDEAAEIFSSFRDSESLLKEAADVVAELSRPSLGNGQPRPEGAKIPAAQNPEAQPTEGAAV